MEGAANGASEDGLEFGVGEHRRCRGRSGGWAWCTMAIKLHRTAWRAPPRMSYRSAWRVCSNITKVLCSKITISWSETLLMPSIDRGERRVSSRRYNNNTRLGREKRESQKPRKSRKHTMPHQRGVPQNMKVYHPTRL